MGDVEGGPLEISPFSELMRHKLQKSGNGIGPPKARRRFWVFLQPRYALYSQSDN